jgi:hypothetical protein
MQSEAVPSWRAAYSDRTSALMALFCELAHDTFVADQSPADQAAPTVAGEAGRNELKRRLEAGSFRLVQVFNKDQAFLAVREGHFAVLAFRGKELLDTDLNLRLVPLPGDGALWLAARVMVRVCCCQRTPGASTHSW